MNKGRKHQLSGLILITSNPICKGCDNRHSRGDGKGREITFQTSHPLWHWNHTGIGPLQPDSHALSNYFQISNRKSMFTALEHMKANS